MQYSLKTLTALAGALALQAGAAMAAGDTTNTTRTEIPKSGQVSLNGTVERVVDQDTFILRDQATGKTVDVHTNASLTIKAGDRVQVNGTAESEALGIGHEIVNASVTTQTGERVGGPYEPMDNDARMENNMDTNTTTPTNNTNY